MRLQGKLVRGLGQASDFTQIGWVRRQLIELAGIDPFPGTVNIVLDDHENRSRWRDWRSMTGQTLEPEDGAHCRASCYPARIEGRIPAAIVLPEVPGYPEDKIELVASLPVREHLSVAEGEPLSVELCRPLAAKTVLFDIDGTLVDSMGAFLEVARIAAKPHGFTVTEDHVRNSLATGTDFWRGVMPPEHRDRDAVRKTMSAHAAREWPRVLREHARVFEGLARTLDALKQRGIFIGIVSGARPEVLDLLREEGILERFDAVVLGADVSRRKPDPEGILNCLGRLGVSPQSAIYVGDTPVDIQASRAAGVGAVGVLSGAANSAMLSEHAPDRLISSHARLPEIVEPA